MPVSRTVVRSVKDARVDAVPVALDGAGRRLRCLARPARRAPRVADYVALTKPRLNVLVVATSAAGYYLGAPATPDLWPMAAAVAGTALVAGGAAVLNQVYERDTDALMRRTRSRPLPDGRVPPDDARIFGLALSALGLGLLARERQRPRAAARRGDARRSISSSTRR